MNNLSDREALKAHGYQFEDSDSDSGKSEFDEEYLRYKPPTLQLDPSRLIVIRPLTSEPIPPHQFYHRMTAQAPGSYYTPNNQIGCFYNNRPPNNCRNAFVNPNFYGNNAYNYQDNKQGPYHVNIASMGIYLPGNKSHLEALIHSNRVANNASRNNRNYDDKQEACTYGNTAAVPITYPPGCSSDLEAPVLKGVLELSDNSTENNVLPNVSDNTYDCEEKLKVYLDGNTGTMETYVPDNSSDMYALVGSIPIQETIVHVFRDEESEPQSRENEEECVMLNLIEPALASCPNAVPSEEVIDDKKEGTFWDAVCDLFCCCI